jgi:hypothetical protein
MLTIYERAGIRITQSPKTRRVRHRHVDTLMRRLLAPGHGQVVQLSLPQGTRIGLDRFMRQLESTGRSRLSPNPGWKVRAQGHRKSYFVYPRQHLDKAFQAILREMVARRCSRGTFNLMSSLASPHVTRSEVLADLIMAIASGKTCLRPVASFTRICSESHDNEGSRKSRIISRPEAGRSSHVPSEASCCPVTVQRTRT